MAIQAGAFGSSISPEFEQTYVNSGMMTGLTSSDLTGMDASAVVNFSWGQLYFEGCLTFAPVTAGGDSGSLWARYDESADRARPVGLHFAGSDTRSVASLRAPPALRRGVHVGGVEDAVGGRLFTTLFPTIALSLSFPRSRHGSPPSVRAVRDRKFKPCGKLDAILEETNIFNCFYTSRMQSPTFGLLRAGTEKRPG